MSLVMFRRGRLLKLTIVIFCLVLLMLFLLPGDQKGQGQALERVVRSRASRVSTIIRCVCTICCTKIIICNNTLSTIITV